MKPKTDDMSSFFSPSHKKKTLGFALMPFVNCNNNHNLSVDKY